MYRNYYESFLFTDGYDENGLQLENISPIFQVPPARVLEKLPKN